MLQEVLALVLDAAIEISGAERAFIMLADAENAARIQAGPRPRQADADRQHVRDQPQDSRRSVPRRAQAQVVADLLDGELADVHMGTVALGIRNVVCVPLNFVHYVDARTRRTARTGASACSISTAARRARCCRDATRAALETLAAEASVAIENARLYREKLEKAKMEQEMRIAAEIQQALLPKPRAALGVRRSGAASIPCRSIGGDFFDYLDLTGASFGFTLGDVAGKGPPAALMSALMQGMFAAQAQSADGRPSTPSRTSTRRCAAAASSRGSSTLMFGITARRRPADLLQRRPQPAVRDRPGGVRRLEAGGPVVGLFEARRSTQETVQLAAGRHASSSSATACPRRCNIAGEEFGDARIIAVASAMTDPSPDALVEALIAEVRAFTGAAPQSDDITALVVAYHPPGLGMTAVARRPRAGNRRAGDEAILILGC